MYGEGNLELKLSPQEVREQLMAAMAKAPSEEDLKVEIEGAFDATAQFDWDRTDPDDLDAWINEAKE